MHRTIPDDEAPASQNLMLAISNDEIRVPLFLKVFQKRITLMIDEEHWTVPVNSHEALVKVGGRVWTEEKILYHFSVPGSDVCMQRIGNWR